MFDIIFAMIFFLGYFKDFNGPRVGHRLHDYMMPFFPLVHNENGFNISNSYGYDYELIHSGIISLYSRVSLGLIHNKADLES